MADVELKPKVDFGLALAGCEAPVAMGPGPAAPVTLTGFNVKPETISAFSLRAAVAFGEVDGGGDDSNVDTATTMAVSPFASAGVKGLLDMCNASASLSVSSCDAAPSTHIEVVATAHVTPGVKRLVTSVKRGLLAWQHPEAAEQGLGGTYFFRDEAGHKVAIMKPCDEEPLAPNNPKGFVGRQLGDLGLKPTVRVGEAAMREVAAYLLDHGHFAKVPHTGLVRLAHPIFHVAGALRRQGSDALSSAGSRLSLAPSGELASSMSLASSDGGAGACAAPGGFPSKYGSLQQFVAHDCDTSELGASRFSARDVRRIGILDVRLFNTDRHAGNMLVRKPPAAGRGSMRDLSALARLAEGQYELLPIDHGFCLPEALEAPYFEWLYWPQAAMPFDEEELQYIASLDVHADIELLKRELPAIRTGCLRTLEVATTLLQRGAAAGLSLAEIGAVASRPLVGMDEDSSELEKVCAAARAALEARMDADADESDSSDGDDEDDDVSDEGVEASDDDSETSFVCAWGFTAAGAGTGAPLASPFGSRGSSGGAPDELLFSFEECGFDGSRGGRGGGASLQLSAADNAGSQASAYGRELLPLTPHVSGAAAEAPAVAKSYCAAAASRRARRRSASGGHKPRPPAAAKYPPHVRGSAPDAVSGVFEGLEPAEWAEFMVLVRAGIDSALRDGRWRSGAAAAAKQPPYLSCPKF